MVSMRSAFFFSILISIMLRPLGFLFVLFLMCSVVVYGVLERDAKFLTVSFLDVGQGDAILIEAPGGVQMLIDGGANRSVLRELSSELPFYDRSIDVVLATHPDADHIGGLSYVLERYQVKRLFHSGVTADTPAYENFVAAMGSESAELYQSRRGTVIDLGGGVYARVLFPDRPLPNAETNTASAVVQLVYNGIEFLLTGDAPESVERYVVSIEGISLASDVLKLGHHGSRTSSSEVFLDAVAPEIAVISAGKDNRYGHPHPDVVARLIENSIASIATFEEGTIVFQSDGVSVWRK